MKFSAKSRFPYASDSPKRSRRRSSKIAKWTAKNEKAKVREAEAPTGPERPRTQESTRSFKTRSPKAPSHSASSTKYATLDETARLQQKKIAEWTARNLANQARIREAKAAAEAEAEAEAAAGYTDAYFAARFSELADPEFFNHDHDNNFVPVNTPPPPAAKKEATSQSHEPIKSNPIPTPSPTTTIKETNDRLKFSQEMHVFNSIPVNKAAPKNDWIAQRLALYNSNREVAMVHQRMVNGETAMGLDGSDEEL
ncbi:hypothetical protein EAE96_002845 [Botrytis aclada]|nr:hypothetical protein EAE96_002845 [Botrytis aclada]